MPDPFEEIERRITEVFSTAGGDIVDDIRQDISTPYPPASRPGQSPHWRTGNLYNGIDWRMSNDGPNFVLLINSPMFYSATLEGPLRRPFMTTARDRWTPLLVSRLQDAVG